MNEIYRRRTIAVLGIILDGAQAHDIVEFVRQQEQAETPDPLWAIPDGGQPLTDEQISELARQAEQVVILENPGVPAAVAMHVAKVKSLFARAVASGEHATAARLLQQIGELEGIQHHPKPTANDHQAQLLLEINRRHLEIANAEPGGQEWETALEFGPAFSPTAWFGGADAERMRWARAMRALIDGGLVLETRLGNARHVRLSEAGQGAIAEDAAA